ncbi:MAG: Two-component system, LuxR family, sensor kinase FixL [Hydrocarboniphaga sp.]|uniref:two-component system sensor histidine kinase NtrB n=1 Tax=Hydrocarboniphaga sp. TaxID=2033016 RepID=UPI002605E68B|nr:PAS domain S-box protein [Hydrocarboniphaga sp.]MDB5971348.1 Two-component system, LuxR family, sensor kinase FixL [Hydrocarboniphaga sp.]
MNPGPSTAAQTAADPGLAGRLAESLEHYRAILDTAVDGIITIDEHGLIQSFNGAAERIFGYRADEVLGLNISLLMPEPYRHQHDGYIEAYRSSGQARIIGIGREVEGRRRDGSVFPMDLSVGEIHLPGRRLFTGITRDITDRKAAEADAQRRLNDLAHVSRVATMGTMATALAHEVNQPLTAIISHAGACLRLLATRRPAEIADAPDSLEALLHESLTQIARQGERAGEVIRQLRRFVRKSEMEFHACQLNRLVSEVMFLLAHEIRATKVQLEFRLADNLPEVAMDRVQIEQVIFNLVRNALEAMASVAQDQRLLWLSTSLVEQDAAPAIRFCAEDRGPGFAGIEPARLFEPYFTTKAGGMGQGLAICHSILESHEGGISAEPAAPRGARFCFWLPVTRK